MKNVLFDLDGTLIDPANGIYDSVKVALRTLGVATVPTDLSWVIGPPLRQSFAVLLGGTDRVEDAVTAYRAHYGKTAIMDATLYPGIKDTLEALKAEGHVLFICTSKARLFAERIAAEFGLSDLFARIYGAEFNGRFDDKAELIAHILTEQNLQRDDTVMIGDRDNDILAAASNGIASVGVLWGYGNRFELTSVGAHHLVSKPSELHQILKS